MHHGAPSFMCKKWKQYIINFDWIDYWKFRSTTLARGGRTIIRTMQYFILLRFHMVIGLTLYTLYSWDSFDLWVQKQKFIHFCSSIMCRVTLKLYSILEVYKHWCGLSSSRKRFSYYNTCSFQFSPVRSSHTL